MNWLVSDLTIVDEVHCDTQASYEHCCCQIETEGGHLLILGGSLLHLRGTCEIQVPLRSANGDVLILNGTVTFDSCQTPEPSQYACDLVIPRAWIRPKPPYQTGEIFGGLELAKGSSDSLALLSALSRPEADIAQILSALEGPWALCFWHQASQVLWVGRDAMGEPLCHSFQPLLVQYTLSEASHGFVAQ